MDSPQSPSTPTGPTCTSAEATAAELTNDRREDALSAMIADPTLGVDEQMIKAAYNLLKIRYAFQSLVNPESYPPLPTSKDSPTGPYDIPTPDLPPLSELFKKSESAPPPSKPGPSQKGKGIRKSRNGFKTQMKVKKPNPQDLVQTQAFQETNPLEAAESSEQEPVDFNQFVINFRRNKEEEQKRVRPLPICKFNDIHGADMYLLITRYSS